MRDEIKDSDFIQHLFLGHHLKMSAVQTGKKNCYGKVFAKEKMLTQIVHPCILSARKHLTTEKIHNDVIFCIFSMMMMKRAQDRFPRGARVYAQVT